ncbi:MAG: SOS response-associated peptidase [Candidatus Kapabacteria bacterium]|nr:SOS response-associated peptidase [Candidatus Kapabacteria bacterium]
MCFTVSIYAGTHVIETDVGAVFDDAEAYTPYYHVNGFVHPELPIIANERPDAIQMMSWGLVPRWTKNAAAADEIRTKTLNARAETLFEKPSFRDAAVKRRALLPVNGFVEWRHDGAIKQPYLVRSRDGHLLTLGCVWEEWTCRGTGEVRRTFSIITTEANALLSWVHNAKQRMPVIIPTSARAAWLADADRHDVMTLMRPLHDGHIEAAPLDRAVSRIKVNTDHPELLTPTGPALDEAPDA